ncbi:DNA replication/repair protein RecF [Rhizobium glycinendophyticum]|uniref:DNA replication and repair protein RecF n=1 Tax=Rhizobium glycinendophyticum TaxID=2589807 RepID=A0A504U7L7_9HYPH|nr:DNA replication/repair protein RecF [Rhizobium glycinendophyticum]TPP09470.1 DNA replication/repair protein RecF [Rhizobium glycinendophyticum]
MTQKTFIQRLKLTDFRNYTQAGLVLDGRHVVLVGKNGAGKTNFMEAISLLSPGRGLRRAVLSDMPRIGATDSFTIFAAVEGMNGEADIGTGTETTEDGNLVRRLRINGSPAKSVDDLTDHLRILWLTPAMDGLFTGPSAERRRFLDRLVLSLDPAHGRRANDFERAMRSRNRLLSEGRFDPSWLSGIEQQMAALGVAMAAARREMLGLLAGLIEADRQTSPFPSAELSLTGFLDELGELPAFELEERYIEVLAQSRHRDAAAGRTLEGPHRADLTVRHIEKNMDAERCSTGEQKALLIGLILAHARLVATMTGFAPILLLDEIAAHLDEGRRAALFDRIDALGGQAFMTGTDVAMFSALGDRAQIVTVEDGSLDV